MPEPTSFALVQASRVVARSIPPAGPLSPAAARQRNSLIRGIAVELDALAEPLRSLTEACEPEVEGEVFRRVLSLARSALARFEGQQVQEPG